MIKCKSPYAYCDKCVIDMGEEIEGVICCDIAEELDFRREYISACCKYAECEDDE